MWRVHGCRGPSGPHPFGLLYQSSLGLQTTGICFQHLEAGYSTSGHQPDGSLNEPFSELQMATVLFLCG
jgi:hypothetical protein